MMNNPYKFYQSYINELNVELKKRGSINIHNLHIDDIDSDDNTDTIIVSFNHSNYTHFAYFILLGDGRTQFNPSSICMHQEEDGLITYAQSDIDKEFLRSHLEHWADYVRNRFYATERIKDFWTESKEELVAAVWHPERVAKWIDAGVCVEDL